MDGLGMLAYHLALAKEPVEALAFADRAIAYTTPAYRFHDEYAQLARVEALLQLGRKDEALVELASAVTRLEARSATMADPVWRATMRERYVPNARFLALAAEHGLR
jgi:hypothetical protein